MVQGVNVGNEGYGGRLCRDYHMSACLSLLLPYLCYESHYTRSAIDQMYYNRTKCF